MILQNYRTIDEARDQLRDDIVCQIVDELIYKYQRFNIFINPNDNSLDEHLYQAISLLKIDNDDGSFFLSVSRYQLAEVTLCLYSNEFTCNNLLHSVTDSCLYRQKALINTIMGYLNASQFYIAQQCGHIYMTFDTIIYYLRLMANRELRNNDFSTLQANIDNLKNSYFNKHRNPPFNKHSLEGIIIEIQTLITLLTLHVEK